MRNELLKEALMRAHKTVEDVAQTIGIDPKTVQRWVNGRVPHARHRWALAQLLDMRDDDLWDLQSLPKQPSLEIIMPYTSSSLQVAQEPCITSTTSKSLSLPNLDMLMISRRQVLREILHTACATFTLSPYTLLSPEAKERLQVISVHSSYVDTNALNDLSMITKHYWKLSKNSSIDILSG